MTHYKINIVNNLMQEKKVVDLTIIKQLEELLSTNLNQENNGEYTKEELSFLISKKTSGKLIRFVENGLLVYFCTDEDEIIAFGLIVKKDDRYQAKNLNVKKEYANKGLGKKLCDIRENILRDMGIKECYIESLKFKKTLAFHQSRGYKIIPVDKKLKYTVYMKLDL